MISLGLNFILGVMLFCALVLGLRLERKLKGLKDSHADFAKAVQELDQAAVRTEDALANLRAGTSEAKLELAARIDQARLLTQRLDAMIQAADKVLDRPLPLHQPVAERAPEPAPIQRQALADPRPFGRPEPAPVPASRSRALVDDDLFMDPGPQRQALFAGARR